MNARPKKLKSEVFSLLRRTWKMWFASECEGCGEDLLSFTVYHSFIIHIYVELYQ